MIELAAAASQPAGPAQASLALSPLPDVARSPDGRSFCTDKPMAQFEAFDLAGGPVERRATSGLTLAAAHEKGELNEAAGPVPADETPDTSPEDGHVWGRQVVQNMAVLPAMVVAVLLIRKSKWRRWCSLPSAVGLLKALKRRIGRFASWDNSSSDRPVVIGSSSSNSGRHEMGMITDG